MRVTLLLLVLASASTLAAQDPPPPVDAPPEAPPLLSVADAQAEMDSLRASTELDESVRSAALALWEQTLTELRAAEEQEAAAAAFDAARKDAPQRLAELREELARPDAGLGLPPPGTPLPELQEALDVAGAGLTRAQQALAALEADRSHRAARRSELPGLIAAARDNLAQASEAPSIPPETPAAVASAQRAHHAARRRRAAAQLAAQVAELASYEARGELLTAKLDAAHRAVQRERARVEALTARVTERRRDEAEAAAAVAAQRARAVGEHALVAAQAERNAELAARRVEVTDLLTEMGQLSLELDRELKELEEKRSRVAEKVRITGFTDSIALLLRRHANELPDPREHRTQLLARRAVLNEIEILALDVEEERSDLVIDPEGSLADLLDELDPAVPPELRADITAGLSELLEKRVAHLTALKEDLERTFAEIVDVNTTETQLVEAVEDYARYIDEHVLWVASTAPLALGDLHDGADALAWLLDGAAWYAVGQAALAELAERPLGALGVAALLLAGLLLRPLVRRRVVQLGKMPRTGRAPSIRPALVVLVYGLLNAAVPPLLLWVLGWWLLRTGGAEGRSAALGETLQGVALLFFSVSLLRRVVLPWGLGEVHLRWPRAALVSVRRHLPLLAVGVLPAYALARMFRAANDPSHLDSLGRAALIVALLGLAAFLQRVLRPSGPVLEAAAQSRSHGLAYATRQLWYPLAVGVPLVLAVAAGFGFHYTAMEFGERLFETWLLVLVVVLGRSTALRFLVIEQRKLRLAQARRRRETQRVEAPESETSASASVSEIMVDDAADEVDLAQIDMQTRRILGTVVAVTLIAGLGWIWAKVLPALGALDRVELWMVTREVASEAGGAALPTSVAVSFADLMVALLTLGVVVVGVRNIPGLLELSVLRRLPLAPGMSYAITTLVRYVLVIAGVVMASGFLGISWDRVQWLVAAISVGLGFGLQEIFANFVSGLIILFERPVRMGDVVTVGNTEGVVTRIRIRATTIRDWDRRELLVPNREFITGQLINWTLTDPITRVVFPVGVAYGSDTKLVTDTLLSTAKAHPLVLGEPDAHVIFRGFGDSALLFELRVFIATREHWIPLTHELNSNINSAFARAGITIPFPQRDVHVRTYGPGGDGVSRLADPGA